MGIDKDQEISDLILRIGLNDKEALEILYEKMAPRMYMVIIQVAKTREDAEDILHESFLRICDKAKFFLGAGSGKGWILKLTRNCTIDYLRKRDNKPHEEIDNIPIDVDNMNDLTDTGLMVKEALSKLSDKERKVISMKYYEDLTIREIAKRLRCPKSTIANIIGRAENQLLILLEKEGS